MTYRARPRLFIILTLIALLVSLMPQIASDRVFSQDPTPLEPQKIESDDALVTRVGDWTLQVAPDASGGSYLYNSGEAALELPFYGASIAVLYVSGPGLGTLVLEVDDTVLRTVITTADNTSYQQTTRIDYLTDEWHRLRVYAQDGSVIGVDAFVAANNPIDADDAGGIQGTPTSVVINEVDMGTPDAIELYNPTNAVINLTGYRVQTYAYNNALEVNYVIPTFYIYPGQYVTLREGAGTNTTNTLYMNQNIGNWIHENVGASGGAVVLSTPYPSPVDFVRWGTATIGAPAGTSFVGTPPNPVEPYTLGRDANSDETDSGSDWSAQCGTLGSRNEHCLVISEVFYGDPSQIELYNGTDRAITLTGYDVLVYDDPDTLDITYTFPAFTLQPGAFVTLNEGAGSNSSTTLYMGQTTGFNNTGGAVWLRDGADVPIDFMRWGAATVAAPAGTSFAGEAIPVPSLVQGSMARRSSLADYDRTSDWCGQVNTMGRANNPCVVINEVDMGEPDSIELYNASTAPYPLDGWQVRLMDSGGNADIPFTVPAFTLAAGSYVRIVEGTGTNTATTLYTTTTIGDWVTGAAGAVSLHDSTGTTIDYVRWGSSAVPLSADTDFAGPTPSALTDDNLYSLGRSPRSTDRDIGPDWCPQPKSMLGRNAGCGSTVVTFNTDVTPDYGVFYGSLQSPPGPAEYPTLPLSAPVEGQWVMGDWDGDGIKTPGMYGTNGVFYHTNTLGANPVWDGTWFGLRGGYVGVFAVAGRFNNALLNDCLGVIDSGFFPGYGAAFALYFTCDTVTVNPSKTVQWLSVLLPDAQGFSGPFEFDAGNYNPAVDNRDTIACRRGPFIAYTNTSAYILESAFNLAQYIGEPSGVSGPTTFVVGDWNNDGTDSFGLVSPTQGYFWYRNDLDWNSGAYTSQYIGFPAGVGTQAATWSPNP
ncbi:MAG: hypothetical protein BroJett018_48110 [Chloroflexota bacterium]|nr:lamin tail domain-containing protein [Chloroflexota bacterium]NOG65852.1 lamin tail domain-containing protein [Chloroflexota bacterium]GIK67017.1 MAG: hypothetical protein BroJett018_48110 [Chloroflexota bacterium]